MSLSSSKNLRVIIKRFKTDAEGSMTVFGLFFFLVSGILGAIAVDVMSLYAQRTHLQVAADRAAHAALYSLAVNDETHSEAKLTAINIVKASLTMSKYGEVIDADDIVFGEYNELTGDFTANVNGTGAVRVYTSSSTARDNPAPTFLFRLIGIDTFDVHATSTFAIYSPECLTEGLVAEGIIDMQNQNFFGKGICIHSNREVQLQLNNIFENGAVVSMPGGRDTIVTPGSSVDDIDGLADALIDSELDLRVLSRIENMIYKYQNPNGTDYPNPEVQGDSFAWPSYIPEENRVLQDLGRVDEITSASLPPNGLYYVDCKKVNQGLTITSGDGKTQPLPVLNEVIIVTPCDVSFGEGSVIQNARIISLSEEVSSFTAPSGVTLGAIDPTTGCETGGAQLITRGGMSFAANFSAYGSQLFTNGNIAFAATPAKANDFKGVSMVSGGTIDLASHVDVRAGCDSVGSGDAIRASFFRMVN